MIINVCDTSILRRDQQSHSEFRNIIKAWLKENYLNKSFVNTETSYDIFVNKRFIEKVTSSFGDIKAHAFTAIPDIIKNAIFVNSEDDKRDRPDILKVLKFEAVISVDGIEYDVWIYVRQTPNQMQLYSLNIKA